MWYKLKFFHSKEGIDIHGHVFYHQEHDKNVDQFVCSDCFDVSSILLSLFSYKLSISALLYPYSLSLEDFINYLRRSYTNSNVSSTFNLLLELRALVSSSDVRLYFYLFVLGRLGRIQNWPSWLNPFPKQEKKSHGSRLINFLLRRNLAQDSILSQRIQPRRLGSMATYCWAVQF